jgi:hypothetical protein
MPETRFRKGDRVVFQFGTRTVQGEVKEDRGPIGKGGRRLFLIEFPFGLHVEEPSHIELPAERLQLVKEKASTK